MACASFHTLPLELKARIVEMTSDQEDAYKGRVKKAERTGHINGLSSLALVNKELRALAAKHQFKVLSSGRASKSIFRFRIFPRYGHHITEINFFDHHKSEGAEQALMIMAQLPALRALRFGGKAATRLFGPGATLRDDLEDEDSSNRASNFAFVASRIETLLLYDLLPSDAIGLVSACSNLRTLGLFNLLEAPGQGAKTGDLVQGISSLVSLDNRSILFHGSSTTGWPMAALAPLAANPPPIKCLQLVFVPFSEVTFQLVSHLSSTIETLTLELWSPEGTPIPSLDLPHLTNLSITVQKSPHFEEIPRILLSTATLSHLALSRPARGLLDLAEPALVRVLASQPGLRRLKLGADLVHSRNLDPSVLDRPHLTPFHPIARLDYTENEADYLEEVLGRTLDFGRIELKRMLADGNVAKAVGWVAKLKALEDESYGRTLCLSFFFLHHHHLYMLSEDILHEVISSLLEEQRPAWPAASEPGSERDMRKVLLATGYACCLVSKAFLPFGRRILYSHLDSRDASPSSDDESESDSGGFQLRVDHLVEHPHLAKFLRECTFEINELVTEEDGNAFGEVVRRWPQIDSFVILETDIEHEDEDDRAEEWANHDAVRTLALDALRPRHTDLHHLTLVSSGDNWTGDREYLEEFTKIRSLHLIKAFDYSTGPRRPLILPSLVELELEQCSDRFLAMVASSSPSLKRITLHLISPFDLEPPFQNTTVTHLSIHLRVVRFANEDFNNLSTLISSFPFLRDLKISILPYERDYPPIKPPSDAASAAFLAALPTGVASLSLAGEALLPISLALLPLLSTNTREILPSLSHHSHIWDPMDVPSAEWRPLAEACEVQLDSSMLRMDGEGYSDGKITAATTVDSLQKVLAPIPSACQIRLVRTVIPQAGLASFKTLDDAHAAVAVLVKAGLAARVLPPDTTPQSTLHFRNLPPDITPSTLAKLIAPTIQGLVQHHDVRIAGDARYRFAFVDLPQNLDAHLAIAALDGQELHGRRLGVEHERGFTTESDSTFRVFVRNLPGTFTSDALWQVLADYAGIHDPDDLSVHDHPRVDDCRIAFFNVASAEELKRVIQALDGILVGGKRMGVEPCTSHGRETSRRHRDESSADTVDTHRRRDHRHSHQSRDRSESRGRGREMERDRKRRRKEDDSIDIDVDARPVEEERESQSISIPESTIRSETLSSSPPTETSPDSLLASIAATLPPVIPPPAAPPLSALELLNLDPALIQALAPLETPPASHPHLRNSQNPSERFSRPIPLSLKLGYFPPSLAQIVLGLPPAFPDDSVLQEEFESFLRAQTGASKEFFLKPLEMVGEFVRNNLQSVKAATSAVQEAERRELEELGLERIVRAQPTF
ncbi:hypothetical protein RQP46_010493 [Phenoliferia psychrophenolica]